MGSQKMDGTELGISSKFTIQIGSEGGAPAKENSKSKGKSTLMDALCAFVCAHGDVGRERVLAVFDAEHFDSVSVETDIAFDAGNIASDNGVLRADIQRFLRDYSIGG